MTVVETLLGRLFLPNKQAGLLSAEVSMAEFQLYLDHRDRDNLALIADEIQKNAGEPLGAAMLIVGGAVNHPFGKVNDIDAVISVQGHADVQRVITTIEQTTTTIQSRGDFVVRRKLERTKRPGDDSNFRETITFWNRGNHGKIIEIIPPVGENDLPLELELMVGKSHRNRYYQFAQL